MIVNRCGIRHEQRRQAYGAELGDGQRASTTDHQVSPGICGGHVLDERLKMYLDTAGRISGARNIQSAAATLMMNVRPFGHGKLR